jgi:hypothetical protein
MTDEELDNLQHQVKQFIEDYSGQMTLFPTLKPGAYSHLDQYECFGFYFRFFTTLSSD